MVDYLDYQSLSIDELRLAYQKLLQDFQKSRQKMDGIFENTQEGIVLINQQGEITQWNQSMVRITGVTKENALGRPIWEMQYMVTPHEHQTPPTLQRIQQMIQNLLSGDISIPVRYNTQTIQRADGTTLYIDTSFSLIKNLPEPTGIGIVRDVTEHQNDMKQLRESEMRYRMISELVTNYAYIIDLQADGRLIPCWISPDFSKITGYDVTDVEGIGEFFQLVHPDDRLEMQKHNEALRSGKHNICELRILSKDGQTHWLRFYELPIWDENKQRIVRILGAALDISEEIQRKLEMERSVKSLKNARERLRYLNRAIMDAQQEERRRIATELHDDIGQMLTVLRITLQQLKNEIPADAQKVQQKLDEGLSISLNILDQVRQLAQGLHPPMLKEGGLNIALERYCEILAIHTQLNIHYTGTDIPDIQPPLALVLYRFLEECMTNILKHAQAVHAWVSLQANEQEIILSVRDDGKGIGQNTLNLLSQKSPLPPYQSEGMGLLKIKETFEMLDGSVSIQSYVSGGSHLTARVPRINL